MPRPAHWPSQEELQEQRKSRNLREGPFPFHYGFCRFVKQPDGTYREELIYFNVTRPRTPEEQNLSPAAVFPVVSSEYGRTFKVVGDADAYDASMYRAEDFELIRLKEVS